MSDYIPQHLLADLLVRIPIDSLMRFRCVSKSWRDLIDSACFTKLHLKRAHLETKIIALNGITFYAFDWIRELGGGAAVNAKRIRNLPLESLVGRVEFVGSSNGLLCLWDVSTHDLVLWNPWTNKFSLLPHVPLDSTTGEGEICLTGAAFGYDHKHDDYKVVIKWHTYANFAFEVYVYSLKVNSWRRITDAGPLELLPSSHECAFANGAFHWLVRQKRRDREPDDFNIVAFDLGTEQCRKVPVPVSEWYGYEDHMLCSLNDRLSCISFYTKRRGGKGELWVMEEYGSWTKVAFLNFHGLIDSGFRPVAFSEENGKMLLQIGWRKLAIYDVKSKSMKDVTIPGAERSCITSCSCVGALVSPSPSSQ